MPLTLVHAVLVHVIHGYRPAGKRVAKGGVIDGPSAQLARLFHAEIPPVPLIEDAVREQAPRSHREPLALGRVPSSPRSTAPVLSDPIRDHGAHGGLGLGGRRGVGEELGRARDGDALAVLQLVEPALDAEVALQNWQSAAPPAMVPSR